MVDILRFALIIGPAFVVAGFAVSSMLEYARAYRVDRRISKVTGGANYGLLPLHVATIATSYLCGLTYVVLDVAQHIHRRPRPLLFILASGCVYLGLVAMYAITKFERKRHNDAISPN